MKRLLHQLASLSLASLLCVASARADPPAAATGEAAADETSAESVTLDLNTASASQLEQLPGIGPSRARAILEFRTAHGGFTQVSQLMRIKGIGRAMLRKLRPLVTVSAAPSDAAKPLLQASSKAGDRLP